jgi:hypothetical protein
MVKGNQSSSSSLFDPKPILISIPYPQSEDPSSPSSSSSLSNLLSSSSLNPFSSSASSSVGYYCYGKFPRALGLGNKKFVSISFYIF